MPGAGQTTDQLTVIKWHKLTGDTIKRGDILLEIETDKAVMPIESFANGILLKTFFQEGDTAYVGDLLAYIGDEADYLELEGLNTTGNLETQKPADSEDSKILRASPAAKKAARDANVSLEHLGQISNNIIRKKDVIQYANSKMPSPANILTSYTLEIEADISQLQDMLKRGFNTTIHDTIIKCAEIAATKYPLVYASYTNLDVYGIKRFTAIINPPENCALAAGVVSNCLYLDNGILKERSIISITASFDHRVIEHTYGAAYLTCLLDYLENPFKFALL